MQLQYTGQPKMGNLFRFFASQWSCRQCSRKKDSTNYPSSAWSVP